MIDDSRCVTQTTVSFSVGSRVLPSSGFNCCFQRTLHHAENKIALSTIDNSSRFALGAPVDLNLATKDDLIIIPGIGEKTAEKILALRGKKGRFKNIEELMEVKGIKRKKLAKFKQYIAVKK